MSVPMVILKKVLKGLRTCSYCGQEDCESPECAELRMEDLSW
jgi:hypothetical protein